jgi:hypothetical protein
MKSLVVIAVIVAGTLGVTGCATTVVPKPGNVTLEKALASVGRGLVGMKNAQLEANNNKDFHTGLVPSEAEVTFNVSASGSQNGELHIELSPVPTIPVGGGANFGTSYVATRGNQITIKFKSLVFATTTTDKGVVTVAGVTDPQMLEKIVCTLRKLDFTYYYAINSTAGVSGDSRTPTGGDSAAPDCPTEGNTTGTRRQGSK